METRKKQSSVIPPNFAEPPTPPPPPIRIVVVSCLNERRIKRGWINKHHADQQTIINANFEQCDSNANQEYADQMHSCRIGTPCTPQELAQIEEIFLTRIWQCAIDKQKAVTDNDEIWGLNWARVDREYASCCAANPGNCKDADS